MGGIMFRPELAEKVMNGSKTVTRRLVSDNPRSPWFREECKFQPGRSYAIQPGRGKNAIGRATVESVRREPLGRITEAEARLEGFASLAEFVGTFGQINGGFDCDAEVWRVELRAVTR